jgi:hypothetical protein
MSKTLKKGKRTGLTRNQQRKADYARLAAASQRKGGGAPVATYTSTSKGKLKRTNHKRGHAKAARDKRRTEGEARNTAWAKLGAKEQIASLDKRLGEGVGAVKQRFKIQHPKTFTEVKRVMALPKEALVKEVNKELDKAERKARQRKKERHDKKTTSE